MHKLGRHYRQPVVLIFSPPIVDCNVLALNEAALLKAPPKCDHQRRERSVRSAVKYSNQRAWLLRARRSGHAAAAPPSSVVKNFRRPI
jgi:hypothetical protein